MTGLHEKCPLRRGIVNQLSLLIY